MQYMPISSDLLSDSEPGHFKEPPPRAGVRRCMSEGSGPQGLPTPSLKPVRGSVRVENSGNMQELGNLPGGTGETEACPSFVPFSAWYP